MRPPGQYTGNQSGVYVHGVEFETFLCSYVAETHVFARCARAARAQRARCARAMAPSAPVGPLCGGMNTPKRKKEMRWEEHTHEKLLKSF